MKKIITTNDNTAIAVLRIIAGIILFAHGAQKMLGWFGGYGFEGTMGFLTGGVHLPYIVALFVILIEFVGSLMLIFGIGTRIAALGVIGLFIGIIITSHLNNGFFMNWSGQQKGEGFEYHLLMIGAALAFLINGAGAFSIDRTLMNTQPRERRENRKIALQ